ncbi:hypothetical protein [Duganella sp. BJB475]|uniref:hypothetical protein n=1 Tax=Duganella sp. BJB475 TaxID=2233914 RepID=UPI000E34B108|nr:hypothetical protein [Duganella sp. BJB475]
MLAIAAGVFISYFPPAHNAEAMWTLIGSFLGYGIRDLFAPGGLAGSILVPGASSTPPGGQGGFARAGMLLVIAMLAAGAMALTGCATPAPGAPKASPQQVLAQVCPAAQITVASLSVLRGLSTEAHDDLAVALPIVDAVCAAGATVDIASLKALNDTALPALIRIVETAPLQPGVHDQIVLGLTVGQIVLAGALQASGPVAP